MQNLTAAIVLAAGGSLRLGRPKQLLEYRAETLIYHAVRSVIDAGSLPTVVVLGSQANACAEAIAQLLFVRADNTDWERGIGSSIRCGIHALLRDALASQVNRVLISLVDQPHVNADFLRELIRHSSVSSRPICASKFDQTIGPPICVARSEFVSLASVRDDRGAKSIWLKRPDLLTTLDCPAAAIDIDTPDDYERLIR